MIQVKVSDGKTECVVDGEPAIIAAELTAIESAVYEQVAKKGIGDLIAVGLVRNAITQTIANDALEKAKIKLNCEWTGPNI